MTDTSVFGDAAPDVIPDDPFTAAKQLVAHERQKKHHEAAIKDLNNRIMPRKALILEAIEDERFSMSQRVDGANVHLHTQIWAGPAENEDGAKDHDSLTLVLDHLGLYELKPSTVNAQRFSAYVREQIKQADVDPTLPLDEQIALALDPALAEVTKAIEKREVRVTGA